MAKRTSRVNESLINFSDKLIKATEQLSETMSNFDSRLEDQNSGFKGLNKTNGILTSISKKMPKKGTFTSLNTAISSNTKAMLKLSNSIGSLINQLANQDLSKTSNVNNINVDNDKTTNIDVNKDTSISKDNKKNSWESYRERRDREQLERTKKEIPLKFLRIFESIQKPLISMNKELGVSYDTLWDMLNVTTKLYANFDKMSLQMLKYGVSFKDILDTQKNIADITGTTNYLTDKQLAQISIMSEKFGVNNKTMSNLSVLFNNIDKSSGYINDKLLDQIGIIADLNDILPASVYEDIEKASEGIALFGYKNVKSLKESVLLSKKWSMNIEKTYSFMDKMVFDFEGSIEKLIEIQTLTGKQIDINKIVNASFTGNVSELIRSEREISKSTERNRMSMKAATQLFGISNNDLLKRIKNTKNATLDFTEETEQAGKGYKTFIDDIVRFLSSGGSAVSSVSGIVIQFLNLATSFKRLKTLKNGMESIEDAIRGTTNATKNLEKSGGLTKAFKSGFDWKSMLGTSAMMLSLAGSFWVLTDAVEKFNNIDIAALKKAGAAMTGFLVATGVLIGGAMALGVALKSGLIVPIGTVIGVMLGFAGASWIFAKSTEIMSNSLVKLIKASDPDKITKMVTSLSLMGVLGVQTSIGISALSASMSILALGMIPLTKVANKLDNIEKLPQSLSSLSNIDLSNLPKALSPLDELIKKLSKVKSLIAEINNNKLNVNIGSQNTNNNNLSRPDGGTQMLINKIDNLIKVIANNREINLSRQTIISLADEIKG